MQPNLLASVYCYDPSGGGVDIVPYVQESSRFSSPLRIRRLLGLGSIFDGGIESGGQYMEA